MTRTVLSCFALGVMAWPSAAATTHKPKHKAHAAGSLKTAKTPKSKSPKTGSSKAKSSKAKSARYKASKRTRRSSQQAPTPERYKEIQQALAAKGYLHGEASGTWDADSADALKRFQADQNLTPDGKINSLSLIALGLGPKRLTAQSHAQVPAETPKTDIPR